MTQSGHSVVRIVAAQNDGPTPFPRHWSHNVVVVQENSRTSRYYAKGTHMMHAADRFLKFAAECQAIAKSSRQQENKRVWNGLAERWLRCAKLLEQFDTELRSPELKRRQKHLKLVTH